MGRKESKVQVTITDVQGRGKCSQGFKKGDTWLIEKSVTPTNFCLTALGTIFPVIQTMRYGGEHPWDKGDVTHACCPDIHDGPVIFEIRRLPPE